MTVAQIRRLLLSVTAIKAKVGCLFGIGQVGPGNTTNSLPKRGSGQSGTMRK